MSTVSPPTTTTELMITADSASKFRNFQYIQVTIKLVTIVKFLRNFIFYLVWSNNNGVHEQFHTLYIYMIEITMLYLG